MLAYYSTRLPAVEINNTFYRLPQKSLIDGWREQVPEDFRFVIKAPRRISHVKRLADCADETRRLFDAVEGLGERLGAVLVQLPPHLRVDVERLESFLALLPRDAPVAFEFRHDSWRDERVLDALRRHGAAWVTVDNDGAKPDTLPRTADWTYLRLRAPEYDAATLRAWRESCEGFERAFVFFKHEDEAAGPAFAERMMSLG
ncbi:MAG: DUF72 domain-containing protein [Gammaproteobacteria bacterium]|nr:DUF72 domain-containing protein [Gammaproteobacteria bacterium]